MKNAKILLADDEPRTLELLGEVLREEGFQVTTAPDGGAALEQLRTEEFSLVITDLHMPVATGADLVAFVRARDLSVPVIIITAHGDAAAREHARAIGASDYITKPIDLRDLVGRVERLLGPGTPAAG